MARPVNGEKPEEKHEENNHKLFGLHLRTRVHVAWLPIGKYNLIIHTKLSGDYFLKQWTITCTGALSTSEQFVEQLPMSTIFLILVLSLIFQFAIAAILISALTFQLFSTMKQMKYFHFHFSSEAMFN